jgi:hypothetical protein
MLANSPIKLSNVSIRLKKQLNFCQNQKPNEFVVGFQQSVLVDISEKTKKCSFLNVVIKKTAKSMTYPRCFFTCLKNKMILGDFYFHHGMAGKYAKNGG